ncbi:MAG: Phosphoribosylamine-glycine ligase [Thermoanaerobacterium thermosaccharolyticum]|jgi:phosphoribosylamine---glycine ligase
MNVLVIGGGGREHAIVKKINESKKVKKIYCVPGNGGISDIAECVDINVSDVDKLKRFALDNNIDLTVVGPEVPLMKGIVDEFENSGLRVFGPKRDAAAIEGSKYFTKLLLHKYNIPTARFKAFDRYDAALNYLKDIWFPVVIKADGLAQGKGVFLVDNFKDAKESLDVLMKEKRFGSSGDTVIIEEMLFGKEVSVLAFTDGNTIVPMVSAMDYKRIYDGDKGPNTGGMGNIAPNPYFDDKMLDVVVKTILKPVIDSLKKEGILYKGVLYAGLILTKDGPKVLEFNARFGDPETQVVLPLLKTDIVDIIEAIIDEKLNTVKIEWEDKKAVCVVASSEGYPGEYKTGFDITGLEDVDGVFVYHAGTTKSNGKYKTSGGRVLEVTALGDTYDDARRKAYNELKKIHFDGMYFRNDIGIV